MSKKTIVIPENVLDRVRQLKQDADHFRDEAQRMERKRSIARDTMFSVIEEALPDLTKENYRVNAKEGILEICSEDKPGIGDMLKDLLSSK